MNNLSYLISAAVGVAALYASASTQADEAFLSPRAQANQVRVVYTNATNERSTSVNRPAGNAKAWELTRSFRTVQGVGPSMDFAHGPVPTLSPKDPAYETALRQLAASQFRVAPIK